MGDYRASIYIKFEAAGLVYVMDTWINYMPDEYTGVDRRITEWLSETWQKCKEKYDETIFNNVRKQELIELEKRERSELLRLKSKYEPKE